MQATSRIGHLEKEPSNIHETLIATAATSWPKRLPIGAHA
jgi:hypothetical protein